MMSELLAELDGKLATVEAKLQTVGDIEERLTGAEAQLAAMLADLDATLKRLAEAKGQLDETEKALRSKQHLLQNEKAKAVAELDRQIVERRQTKQKLEDEITSNTRLNNDIVAQMQSLGARLKV
jgi:chromosome segregation ATPase